MKWEPNEAIALSCQSFGLSPGVLGPRKYLPHCQIFMVPLPSEMNFAQGGGGVIMKRSLCVFGYWYSGVDRKRSMFGD